MAVGCARAPTVKQDIDRQIDALVREGIPRERIYFGNRSGASADRPGLTAVIAQAVRATWASP